MQVAENVQVTMLRMLPNGNLNRSKGSILLENTTAFDTLIHIISCRLLDDENFKRNFMSTAEKMMADFFQSFLSTGPQTRTLHLRYEVKQITHR